MFLASMFHRIARWLFPVDHHIAIGEPRPIGRKGFKAGVWLAFDLGGKPASFIVGTGIMMMQPIAAVWGSEDCPLNSSDYRLAVAIAKDWELAYTVPGKCLDLRDCQRGDACYESIQNLVLFPTTNRGHQAPQKFSAGCTYTDEGYSKALDASVVPWTWNKAPEARLSAAGIPVFDMPGLSGGDWAPVPADLNAHLEKFNPGRIHPTKNGGLMPLTHPAGNCESQKASAAAA